MKNPHGQGGGFPKCPCLSTRGEGGVKKPKKTVHMVCRCPLMFLIQGSIAVVGFGYALVMVSTFGR